MSNYLQQAAAAHAQMVELLQSREGRGFDLESLLQMRHLSRMFSLWCGSLADEADAHELESQAGQLLCEPSARPASEIAYAEQRLKKVLAAMAGRLRRPVSICRIHASQPMKGNNP